MPNKSLRVMSMRFVLPSEVRIMRLVAGIAGHAARVFDGRHLREALGFGGILFMTAPAEVGHLGQFGDDGAGVVGVFGQRPVAGFAGDVRMFAGGAGRSLLVMAHHAGFLSGVVHGVRADQVQRGWPVMPVLSEVFRNHSGPDDEKYTHAGNQDQGRADQVYPIAKTAQGAPFRTVELRPRLSGRRLAPPAGTCAIGSSITNTKRSCCLKYERNGPIC